MSAVYFIYPLDEERLFWALWPNALALEYRYAPQHYAIVRTPRAELVQELEMLYSARWVELPLEAQRDIYRQVRRGELPWEVQKQIRQAILDNKTQRHQYFEALGFRPQDWQSAKHLKRRYYQLAREHHPDNGGAEADFIRLKKAYLTLLRRLF